MGSGKILQLFELLRKEEKLSREQIISKIYGKGKETDKAVVHAYYQLRLRLNEKIENFILEQVHKEDTGTFIKNLVSIAGLFFRRRLYQLAWHYVKKAEELAVNSDKYGELNLLYALQIEYHWRPYAPDIEELVNKINKNLVRVKKEYDLNSAVALIKHRISEARQPEDIPDVESIVQDILKAYPIDKKVMNTTSFKYKVTSIVGYILYEKKDFDALEQYLIKAYKKMEQTNMFDRYNNYQYKINLLANISMANFKIKEISLSEKYLKDFHEAHLKYKTQVLPNVYYIINGRIGKGISAQALHKTVLAPLDAYGFCCSVYEES